MPFRLGLFAAIVAVVVTVTSDAGAVDQMVFADQGPNRFAPAAVTVNVGEKVTWHNNGGIHNVQFNDGSYEMPADPDGSAWTVERTFTTVGTFTYICREHPTSMSGSVTVQPAGTPPPAAPPGTNPPGGTPPTGPQDPGKTALKVSLNFSDATPLAGKRVRLFGTVRPARDGDRVQIQKRLRNGKFKTIATARLKDAGAAKSTYSIRLKLSADVVLRARVVGDDETLTGLSRGRRLDVHRPA